MRALLPVPRLALAVLPALLVLAACRRDTAPDGALDSLAHEHAGDSTAATGIVQPPRVPVTSRAFNYGPATGHLALPRDTSGGSLPGLIVVHEWWGLNDNVRRMAERLAGEGYRVLAVDLYGGRVAETPDSAMAFVQATMGRPMAVAGNVRAAFTALARMGAPKVGILGWCFGGGVSANMMVAMPLQLDAAVIYYGNVGGITAAQLRPVAMPVLGLFGGQDSSIPLDTVRAFEQRLQAAGKDAAITIYPEAGHAFANPTGDNYEAGPAEDAWKRTTAFLARTLR
jgi:carboxymethylenebutenolidase